MFCKKCGNSVSVSSHFCSNCGAKIPHSSSREIETLPNMSSIPQENVASGKTIKSNSNVEQDSRIETVSINCPRCGGEIQTMDGLDTFFCMYCGNKVVLSGMSDASYDAKVRSKKIDQEERMQVNAFSHQKEMFKMKADSEHKSYVLEVKIAVFSVLFLFLIIGGLVLWLAYPYLKEKGTIKNLKRINEEIDELLDDEEYDEAEKLNKKLKKETSDLNEDDEWCTWIDIYLENYYDIEKGKRREENIKHKKIKLSTDLEEIDDLRKDKVIDYLIKSGFINISCVAETRTSLFEPLEGSVDGVFIDGDDDWEAGEVFYDDVEVIVKVWA